MRWAAVLVATTMLFAGPVIAAEPNVKAGSVDDPKAQIWIACLDTYVKQSYDYAPSDDQLTELAVKECQAKYLAWNGFHIAAAEAAQANMLMMAFAETVVHETRHHLEIERLLNEPKPENVRQ